MMSELPDVNLLLCYLDRSHIHHVAARTWFERELALRTEIRIAHEVALACVRLAANARFMRVPVAPRTTYDVLATLLQRDHVELIAPTPASWKLARDFLPERVEHAIVPDAHLAALAIATGCRLVTFDDDVLRFEGLAVELLTP